MGIWPLEAPAGTTAAESASAKTTESTSATATTAKAATAASKKDAGVAEFLKKEFRHNEVEYEPTDTTHEEAINTSDYETESAAENAAEPPGFSTGEPTH